MYREVLDISLTQSFPVDVEAQKRYRDLQEKMTKSHDAEASEGKQIYLDQLKTELNLLERRKDECLESFVDFLFEEFPPKHKKRAVKPEVLGGDYNKVLITLSAFYHPDKVDAEVHGMKYKVLCEEIVKVINLKLGQYKAFG